MEERIEMEAMESAAKTVKGTGLKKGLIGAGLIAVGGVAYTKLIRPMLDRKAMADAEPLNFDIDEEDSSEETEDSEE